jgi:hypothetical protein
MAEWWSDDPEERYWCEITDRPDVGADLKCPQTNEVGQDYWSYSLIRQVWPGDIVFHYWTPAKAVVGASVAGAPLEERPIVWAPHGTVGRAKPEQRLPRPGWWLPLYGYRPAAAPLSLASLRSSADEEWIRTWITEKAAEPAVRRVAAPFQRYAGQLRAAQGYLSKMPAAFVARWPLLSGMVDLLAPTEDALALLAQVAPPPAASSTFGRSASQYRPKSEADYEAVVRAQVQRRTRRHERLVREVGEWLRAAGGTVTTPHPIDLFLDGPVPVLFEAEVVAPRGKLAAVREAVGQLHEYRWFVGPRDGLACVLLDEEPGPAIADYVEKYLDLLLAWWSGDRLVWGTETVRRLAEANIRIDVP